MWNIVWNIKFINVHENTHIYTRCSMGGAKAPPISRVVPSHRRSVAQLFRRTDVPTCRSSDAPQSRCSGPSVVANQR